MSQRRVRHVSFWASLLVPLGLVVGCSTSHPVKAEPPLTISKTWTASAASGFTIHFSNAVKTVTWTWQGKVRTTTVQPMSSTVTIPVTLPQDQSYTLTINKAAGVETLPMTKPVVLTGHTEEALKVITNPGIWQYGVSRTEPITLTFTEPIANPERLASEIHFDPTVSGKVVWMSENEAEFVPDEAMPPTQEETMSVSAGTDGPLSTEGQYLSSTVVRPFITQSDETIVVKETLPETLSLYEKGRVIFKSLCNTGVTGASTPPGSYFIRSKLVKADMKGQDPDGEKYDIPGVPWVMGLFGNTAIHGYPREKYGFPQSNGCVELPIAAAKSLFSLVKIGTPVVIEH